MLGVARGLVAAGLLAGCGGAPAAAPSSAASSASAASAAGASPKAAAAPASAQASAAGSGASVKLGTNPVSPSNGFVWVGQQQGIFAQNGLAAEVQGLGGSQRINSMVAGQIDAEVGGGPQEFVAARAEGRDLTIVATFSRKFDDVIVVPNSVTKPEDLRGKNIGSVTPTAVDAQGLVMYLRKFGMEPARDYKIVGTGSNASQAGPAAAVVSRQVDAAVLQEDFAKDVVAKGDFHVLVDFYTTDLVLPGVPVDFRTEFIQQHPDAVQKTVDSLIQSVRYTKEHPAETKALWAKQFKMEDQARLSAIYDREMELWQKEPMPDPAALTDVIDFMSLANPKVKALDPAKLIDSRFVQDAARRGLTKY
jgi:NitT/TauT family transport system substrate-binding protein